MDPDIQTVFRQAMRRLASTVSVITCVENGTRFGMTATAVTSLSAEPASVLVCLNQRATITVPLLQGGRFCVNILQSHQAAISAAFGGKAAGEERFAHGTWREGEHGIPFLADAQANLFCCVDGEMPYGTHRIVVGRLESGVYATEVAPLLFQDGGYAGAHRMAA